MQYAEPGPGGEESHPKERARERAREIIIFAGPTQRPAHAGTGTAMTDATPLCPLSAAEAAGRGVCHPRAPVGATAWRRWLPARKRVSCAGPGTRGTGPSRVCRTSCCAWCLLRGCRTRRHVRAPSKAATARSASSWVQRASQRRRLARSAASWASEIPRFLTRLRLAEYAQPNYGQDRGNKARGFLFPGLV